MTLRLMAVLGLACCLAGCFRSANPADYSDSGLKATIEAKLRSQPDLDLRFVTVDVNSGAVTISGMVNTFREKELIYRLAHRTRGVDQVMVNLLVPE